MAGISSKAAGSLQNRYKFNDGTELENKEFSDGSGIEIYATQYRSYDPQIGRFHQIDPLADYSNNRSPYVYCMNNPLRFNDPLGLDTVSTTMNGKNVNIPSNLSQDHTLSINNPNGSISYYNYDPTNPDANAQGYVGSGIAGTNEEIIVSSKSTNNSNIRGMSSIQYYLSIPAGIAENLGGFENAMTLLKEGKFQMSYNGELKTWSLNFYGNKSVAVELVQANKTAFAAKATGNIAFFKAVKVGGVVLNVAGILTAGWDMKKNGINPGNATDMAMSGAAFIPGYGWIISGVYFTIGATVGWDNAIPSYIEVEKNKSNMRNQGINNYSDFKY